MFLGRFYRRMFVSVEIAILDHHLSSLITVNGSPRSDEAHQENVRMRLLVISNKNTS